MTNTRAGPNVVAVDCNAQLRNFDRLPASLRALFHTLTFDYAIDEGLELALITHGADEVARLMILFDAQNCTSQRISVWGEHYPILEHRPNGLTNRKQRPAS